MFTLCVVIHSLALWQVSVCCLLSLQHFRALGVCNMCWSHLVLWAVMNCDLINVLHSYHCEVTIMSSTVAAAVQGCPLLSSYLQSFLSCSLWISMLIRAEMKNLCLSFPVVLHRQCSCTADFACTLWCSPRSVFPNAALKGPADSPHFAPSQLPSKNVYCLQVPKDWVGMSTLLSSSFLSSAFLFGAPGTLPDKHIQTNNKQTNSHSWSVIYLPYIHKTYNLCP